MTFVTIDGIKIIPMHLNIVFTSEYFSFNSNLDEKRFTSIVQDLNDDEIYVLDFFNIRNTLLSDSIAKGAEGLLNKKVLMINLKTSTYNTFIGYFSDKMIDFKTNELGNSLKTKLFPHSTELPNLFNFCYLYDYLENICRENIPKVNEPRLISSNIYINKHFDLRKLFGNMDTVKIAVYLMAIELEKLENEKGIAEYKLISSSINGCILANLLALIIGRDHISIPHLGPDNTIEDNRYTEYIKKNDKLVYIYDFIAFGNEQRIVSIIANLLGAEIICSFGLTYFKPSVKELKKTNSLINFKNIVDEIYIAADEEGLRKIIGETNA